MNTTALDQPKSEFMKLVAAVGLLAAVVFTQAPFWALPLMVKYYDLLYGAALVHRN